MCESETKFLYIFRFNVSFSATKLFKLFIQNLFVELLNENLLDKSCLKN